MYEDFVIIYCWDSSPVYSIEYNQVISKSLLPKEEYLTKSPNKCLSLKEPRPIKSGIL